CPQVNTFRHQPHPGTHRMVVVSVQETPLLSGADIRRLADELGLRPTKTLGQNYVIDPNTIRRIVAEARLSGHSHVLEVGPGLGSLTLGLLDVAAAVTAVEIDPIPAQRLTHTLTTYRPTAAAAGAFIVIEADALRITRAELAAR